MKTTTTTTLMITLIGFGLAGSLSATPRSKQIGTPGTSNSEASSHSTGTHGSSHLKHVGPRSKW